MSEKLPMTADGLAKLKSELENLKNSERPNIIKAIAEAREHGDLSENAEYQAARDLMNWLFTADQNDQQRAASILIAQMDADAKSASGTSSLFQTVINAIANIG